MELASALMEAFDLKEDQSKNDLTVTKRGATVELTEARDIAGHIQFMTGETTVASLKELFEERTPAGHLGNVFLVFSTHEKCPNFLAFMKKQARRLKFKLVVFASPLPAHELTRMDQLILERGGSRMQ
jgi:hypothetical protein